MQMMRDVTRKILERYKIKESKIFDKLKIDEIGEVVSDGVTLDLDMKQADKELTLIKPFLLAYAKHKKEKRFAGIVGFAEIKKKTSSFISPKDLLQYLVKCDKKNLFYALIKVGITDTKKFLGEEALKEIIKVETKEYGSVSFKENKS